ncbi:hypothetical protein [Wenzhouxiangella marina]|nr:hypothetical protein [Wenzhouxiangella marina]MBB6088177.1 hypothetical protein [Wenzhouxiangella marina]
MTRRILAAMQAASLLFLASCASAPPKSNEGDALNLAEPVRLDELEIADTFGDFGLGDLFEYDEAGLGVQIRYLDKAPSDRYVDVYVYPIHLPDGLSLADVLEFEQYSLDRNLMQAWDEPQGRPAALIRRYQPRSQDPSAAGLLSARTVAREGRDYRTHTFLSIMNDAILKVRMSVDSSQDFPLEAFERIVDGVSAAIRFRDRPTRELSIVITPVALEVASQGQSCMLGAWLGYGMQLTAELGEQHYLNDLERELSARRMAMHLWNVVNESDQGPCESNYMTQLELVASAGFLAEHVFHYYGRPYWGMTEDLRLEEYFDWARDQLRDYTPIPSPGILIRWKEPE